MIQATRSGLLRTHAAPRGWHITSIECARGLVRVESHEGVTEVVVADVSDDSGPDFFSAAACTSEGNAMVMARRAPPALLLASGGQRVVPSSPGDSELLRLDAGELLLMLSAAAFETMPDALVRVLHGLPGAALGMDPRELLTQVFDEIGSGSGAVLGRVPNLPSDEGGAG
jgi:hypothetical protein